MSGTTSGTAGGATSGVAPTDGATAADGAISEGRARIDAIDRRIMELVRERMAVSASVQRARMAAGGRRVHLSREMEVLAGYRDALGRSGTTLAMTLLELCRGRV